MFDYTRDLHFMYGLKFLKDVLFITFYVVIFSNQSKTYRKSKGKIIVEFLLRNYPNILGILYFEYFSYWIIYYVNLGLQSEL